MLYAAASTGRQRVLVAPAVLAFMCLLCACASGVHTSNVRLAC